jgi:hypothetical protein
MDLLMEVSSYQPDLVVDYTEEALKLNFHARAFMSISKFSYSEIALTPANQHAKRLRENPETAWPELVIALSSYYGWGEAVVIGLGYLFKFDSPGLTTTTLFVSELVSQNVIDKLVTREVRQSGIRQVFILASQAVTEAVLRSLAKYDMNEGYAVVLIGTNCQFDRSLYPQELLCFAHTGTESASSPLEVEFWYVYTALTSGSLADWVPVNSFGSKYKVVGNFKQSHLTLTSSAVFPGSKLTQPNDEPFPIHINLNNWFTAFLPQQTMTFAFEDFPLKARRFLLPKHLLVLR